MDAAAEGAIDADGGGGAVRERGERRARGISLGEVFFFLRRVWVIAAVLICFPVACGCSTFPWRFRTPK